MPDVSDYVRGVLNHFDTSVNILMSLATAIVGGLFALSRGKIDAAVEQIFFGSVMIIWLIFIALLLWLKYRCLGPVIQNALNREVRDVFLKSEEELHALRESKAEKDEKGQLPTKEEFEAHNAKLREVGKTLTDFSKQYFDGIKAVDRELQLVKRGMVLLFILFFVASAASVTIGLVIELGYLDKSGGFPMIDHHTNMKESSAIQTFQERDGQEQQGETF